ncbi:neutral cholesterol ester hydrolase 1-like [Branchiostoma floridae]|uniref:Neutral cholesterol ester hydrolase 1-like n=2 Tax=Branchiostoma floridae TaxID=7739 RepID=A0A9J7M188_BRAFL|nr:neutral cholesterol ester hydrolase 1-like [Branchiostoma floridae]
MVLKAALMCVAVAALLAYYCNEPVPQGIAEPRLFAKVNGIVFRTAQNLGRIGEYLGVGTEPQIIRSVVGALINIGLKLKGTSYREGLKCTDAMFDGVNVRVYEPTSPAQSGSKVPGLVYLHGGGWVILDVDTYDPLAAHIAKQLGAVVVSVDYRRAPEHLFPTAFDDSVAATKFFLQNAEKYNVDRTRIGISGDSAGGNLAAAVTLALAKEKGLPKFKTQALIYPVLQAINFTTPSYINHGHLNTLTKDKMVSFWLWYLNNDLSFQKVFEANNHTSVEIKKSQYAGYVDPEMVGVKKVKKGNLKFPDIPNIAAILDPRFAPLMADDADLKGLPPTYVMTCEYDVLRDDGVMYAKRLGKAGVKVNHDHYQHGFHGFLNMFHDYESAGTAMQNYLTYLKNNL